ncbi:hypothetical protein ACFQ5J_06725 [Lacticaseibacillus baoqingensis]|uniref:Integral membrane protein n=1 Tax=Lacticaseibacillus baoqingensis TaxID=2486013 RepID=A0ABW4E717_9LACO|nr:hypothetical protein [Lacticaseibacillus baoqingensis]
MTLALILILLIVVITIALGVVNYQLGKHGRSRQTGVIIPIAYFIIRVAMTIMAHGENGSVLSSATGALLVAVLYYAAFVWGMRRQN